MPESFMNSTGIIETSLKRTIVIFSKEIEKGTVRVMATHIHTDTSQKYEKNKIY